MSRNPRVLVLSYLFPNSAHPGYGVFVLQRILAVSRRCALRVIAPIPWFPFIGRLRRDVWGGKIPRREMLQGLAVEHPRFPIVPRFFKWFDALSFSWSVAGALRRLRKSGFEFDLIDVHWTYPDIFAAQKLSRRSGRPYIVTVRGHEALYADETSIRRRLVAAGLRRAHAVVALSEELRTAVVALGVDPARVHVILNGVDQARFFRADMRVCRDRLQLPQAQRIILSVGRLTEGKGHQHVIQALAQIRRTQDAHLYIVGGVNPESRFDAVLRDLVAQLDLAQYVHFRSEQTQEQLAAWYGAADVFCLASHREGCPNVVLEALACGTPVVVNDVGAVAEFVKAGQDGALAPPGNQDELTTALGRALHTTWDRAAIAERMRARSWDSCATRVVELYQAVLK